MWWLATTASPVVTATVLLSSAPTARIGRGPRRRAAASGSGRIAPRPPQHLEVARPARTRTTESSQRMWMGRSWTSTPSTSGPRRATASSSSWAMGSSLRLPLVITSGRPTPASSRWCSGEYGRSRPSSASPGATPAATGRPRPTGREHDRPARATSARRRRSALSSHSAVGRVQVGHHHRERLVVAGLAAAQLGHRRRRRWRRRPGGSRRCP